MKPPPGYEELTEREREVFGRVARRSTNAQIADRRDTEVGAELARPRLDSLQGSG